MNGSQARTSFWEKTAISTLVSVIWTFLLPILGLLLVSFGVYQIVVMPEGADATVTTPRIVTGAAAIVAGGLILFRYLRLLRTILREQDYKLARKTMRADLIQAFLLVVLVVVLFPVVWILSMSLDPRGFSRPTGLTIIPPSATFDAYRALLERPSPNDVSFFQLVRNSLIAAGGTAVLAVVFGTTAAYAFSRFEFPGRRWGMLGFVLVLMIPPGGTLAPLYVLLNSIRLGNTSLRQTLLGLVIAYTSAALPFSIWNMKGFIDSLPYDLEEAALIDGCTPTQAFIRVVLPLATPGMAVTALQGFLTGWSEFILAWTFLLQKPNFHTLPMVLRGMVGQYASQTPWSKFAAMSILMSIPAVLVFFFLQRYLVAGLAAGGVKG